MSDSRFRSIQQVQGIDLYSPLAGQTVTTRGVVTGSTRKGFFLQDPDPEDTAASSAIFVYSPRQQPPTGSFAEVRGEVMDFRAEENDRPTTQIKADSVRQVEGDSPDIEPVWLTADLLDRSQAELASLLNSLEGRLVGIRAGATFVSPSNAFGDYVLAPKDLAAVRTQPGGVLIDPTQPERWLPNIRVRNYSRASKVDVGSKLNKPVVGPLNFRAASYQIAAAGPLDIKPAQIPETVTQLAPAVGKLTILTLNGFNLDPQIENPQRVKSQRDIDDDIGDGRFAMLAAAIVHQALCPDVIALQEIQDNDGAEVTGQTNANRTYSTLIKAVQSAGGPEYHWADIPPKADADGGQPGGNIRNGFLYRADRVQLLPDSLKRIGENHPAFEGSRKPIVARFQPTGSNYELAVVNVHLASKRHQHGLFAPDQPGFDPRLQTRVQQVSILRSVLRNLSGHGIDYYVTGDFNDFEFSETLATLNGDDNVNLVDRLPLEDRYDYNHRGISQALMHGVVSKNHLARRRVEYEILHGNALLGIQPGGRSHKGSDHAYVIARLEIA